MKLKKAIGAGVLTCCLAVMGMFSFGALHTEAAICKHTIMQGELNAQKDYYINAEGHFTVYGDHYSCPQCLYNYWENVYTRKTDHVFESHSGTDYTMKCSICGFSK